MGKFFSKKGLAKERKMGTWGVASTGGEEAERIILNVGTEDRSPLFLLNINIKETPRLVSLDMNVAISDHFCAF